MGGRSGQQGSRGGRGGRGISHSSGSSMGVHGVSSADLGSGPDGGGQAIPEPVQKKTWASMVTSNQKASVKLSSSGLPFLVPLEHYMVKTSKAPMEAPKARNQRASTFSSLWECPSDAENSDINGNVGFKPRRIHRPRLHFHTLPLFRTMEKRIRFMQLDLGQLQVRNEFRWHVCPEKDLSAIHLDVLDAEILGINMAVGIDGCIGKPMIRDGQGINVYVRRSLRDVFWKVPTFSLGVKTRNATGLVAPAIAASLGALTHTLGTLVPVIGARGFATAAAATAMRTVVSNFK